MCQCKKYSINELTGLSKRHFVQSSSISRLSHPFWAFLHYFCAALSCTFDFWAEASLHTRQRVPRRVMSLPCFAVPVRLACRGAKTLTARVRPVMFFCHMVAVWIHISVTPNHSWWIPCQGFGTADNGRAKQPADAAMTKCARLYQREQGRLWNEAVYRPATLITNPARGSEIYRSRVTLALHLKLCRNDDLNSSCICQQNWHQQPILHKPNSFWMLSNTTKLRTSNAAATHLLAFGNWLGGWLMELHKCDHLKLGLHCVPSPCRVMWRLEL